MGRLLDMIKRSESEQGGYNRGFVNQPKGDSMVPNSIYNRLKNIGGKGGGRE